MASARQRLMLNRLEGGELFYALEGRRLASGTTIEVRLPAGGWVCGLFRWRGDASESPTLMIDRLDPEVTGDEPIEETVVIRLAPGTVARWSR